MAAVLSGPSLGPADSPNPDRYGVIDLDGQSQYYRVILSSKRWGMVWAWLPDTFMMTLVENWQYVIGSTVAPIIQFGIEAFTGGTTPNTKYLTGKVWTGSNPLQFSLPLKFIARRDAISEVINPIKLVMKMALPYLDGNTLKTPGPVIAADIINAIGSFGGYKEVIPNKGDNITLYIGNYLRIPNIYIENVNVSFKGLLNSDGDPMESSCQLTCNTAYAPTANDIESWILPGSNQIGSGRPTQGPSIPTS